MKLFLSAYVLGHASVGHCQDTLKDSAASNGNDEFSKSGDQYTSKFIGNSAHVGSGNDQTYVDQYAGAYRKQKMPSGPSQGDEIQADREPSTKNVEQSDTPGPGSYQKYMNQYAKGYMGASSGQQAGGSAAGAGASAQKVGYQHYMSQYVGSYSGGGPTRGDSAGSSAKGEAAVSSGQGANYQQFMNQYAGDYLDTGSAQSGGAGSSQGGSHQQYVDQYAREYMGGASTKGAGGSAGGDHQQNMNQYDGGGVSHPPSRVSGGHQSGAGPMELVGVDAKRQGSKGADPASEQPGGANQQYMKTYAGPYMNQGAQSSSASQKKETSTSSPSSGDYQKYMDQYAGDFIKQYTSNTTKQQETKQEDRPQGPASAAACNTTEELDAWKAAKDYQLKFVPAAYQMYLKNSIEAEYKTNYERITGHAVPSEAEHETDRVYDKLLDDTQATSPPRDQVDKLEAKLQDVLSGLRAEKATTQKQLEHRGRASDDVPKKMKESAPTRSRQGGESERKGKHVAAQSQRTKGASELAEISAADTQSLPSKRLLSAVGCGLLSMSLAAFFYRRNLAREEVHQNPMGGYFQLPPSQP